MSGGKWTATSSAAARDYGSGEEVGAVTPRASFRKVKGLMDGTSLPQLAFYTVAASLMVFGVMAAQGTQSCSAPRTAPRPACVPEGADVYAQARCHPRVPLTFCVQGTRTSAQTRCRRWLSFWAASWCLGCASPHASRLFSSFKTKA